MKIRRLLTPFALALGFTLTLFWGLGAGFGPLQAMRPLHEPLAHRKSMLAAPQAELRVCPTGCDYTSIQAAVDDADPGAVIKVSEGTYSDLHQRDDFVQVVYVDKSVTIEGGYAPGSWTTPDPDAHRTVIDAQGAGHAVNVTGPGSSSQSGGASSVAVTLGGLHITGGSGSSCGGVWIYGADATLAHNHIYGNQTNFGAGLCVEVGSTAHLVANVIRDNVADYDGGGIYAYSSQLSLVNNVIIGNRAGGEGAGVYLFGTHASFLHTTIANNGSSMPTAASPADPTAPTGGTGVYVGPDSSATLVNTILARQHVGVGVEAGSSADLDAVLWFENGADHAGSGSVAVTRPFVGPPDFAPDGYHIGPRSAAIDRAVPSGVPADIDGEPRRMGIGPDLGADEGPVHAWVGPHQGGRTVYTDPLGLATIIDIPPGAVVQTATFSFEAVTSPTHPLPDGARFAHRAFELVPLFEEAPAAIGVAKSAVPAEVTEPGGDVAFELVITNTSLTYSATLTSLLDDPYGDVTDAANPELLATTCETKTLPPGHCYRCVFTATVAGAPGERVTDTLTVEGVGGDGTDLRAEDSASVAVVDVASSMRVTKTATAEELPPPGGAVTFTVDVLNLSSQDALTLTALVDDPYGDLTDPSNPALLGTTCRLATLSPGATYHCSFAAMVAGGAGEWVTDTVTVSAVDDDGSSLDAEDDAAVRIAAYSQIYLPFVARGHDPERLGVQVDENPGWSPLVLRPILQTGGSCVVDDDAPYPCLTNLQKPITVTIRYSCDDVVDLDEADLRLYYWTGASWEDVIDACPAGAAYTRDPETNLIQVPVCHLSEFALGG